MTWNYRIVDHKHHVDGKWVRWSQIEEVYYGDEDGDISHTGDGVPARGDNAAEVVAALKMMVRDVKRSPPMPCRCETGRRKRGR